MNPFLAFRYSQTNGVWHNLVICASCFNFVWLYLLYPRQHASLREVLPIPAQDLYQRPLAQPSCKIYFTIKLVVTFLSVTVQWPSSLCLKVQCSLEIIRGQVGDNSW